MDEHQIYEDNEVKITNAWATIQGKTYAIENITRVDMGFTRPSLLFPVLLLIVGAFFLLYFGFYMIIWSLIPVGGPSSTPDMMPLVGGIAFIAISISLAKRGQNTYFGRLASPSGGIKALRSKDIGYIQKIVTAMNEAIGSRGSFSTKNEVTAQQ